MNKMTEKELVDLLEEARYSYYNESVSIMSDARFDALEEELKKINPKNEYFNRVGIEAPDDSQKVVHFFPMLSANKVKNANQLRTWMDRLSLSDDTEWIIEPKIDGISCSVFYRKGKLTHIATRGDGKKGKNITYINNYMKIFPLELEHPVLKEAENLDIRGELFLSKKEDSFRSEENENRPLRNICAGLISRKENREAIKSVRFLSYSLLPNKIFNTESDKLNALKEAGFNVVQFSVSSRFIEVEDYLNLYIEKLREEWEFETDGLIVSVNDNGLFEEINSRWVVDHHNHYVVAVKPPPAFKISRLITIEWQISRLGNLIPVAVFEPVRIGGALIQKATLNNWNNVIELDLRSGDNLKIERANDVIPYIAENMSATDKRGNESTNLIPDKCPSCEGNLEENGIHLRCPNHDCPERVIQKILFWVQRSGMENIAEGTIRFLHNEGVLKSVKDLYSISKEELLPLEGFQEKKAENFVSQVEKTRKMAFDDFISSLGIESVQKKSIQKLKINDVESFIHFSDDSYVIGRNIIRWKDNSENMDLFHELADIIDFDTIDSSRKKSVVFTGSAPFSRKEAQKKAEDLGYEVFSAVTKDLDVLVTDTLKSTSSKMKKASRYGTRIMTYREFFSQD